ncbi:MAG: hypothetical protein PHO42_05360 [Candidatus Omnitrophica bacterium]|nr:hypothetical protein [Candidatus Omnitrophota bacterium]
MAKRAKNTTKARKAKKGYSCSVCGLEITVDNVCGCVDTCDIICCGKDMNPRK